MAYYISAVYNPHTDKTNLVERRWNCNDPAEHKRACEQWDRWREALEGQGLTICSWFAECFYKYGYHKKWDAIVRQTAREK